jgi:membrane-associated phospholipid phosphatase
MRRVLTVWAGVVAALTVTSMTAATAQGPAAPKPARLLGAGADLASGGGSGTGALVVRWNQELLRIVRTPGAQPATVHPTRSFAIMSAAVYDAVVSITHRGRPYIFDLVAPRDASAPAAAAQAAADVLTALYPGFAAEVGQQLGADLAAVPDGRSKQDGIRIGRLSARFLLAARDGDGSAASPPVLDPRPTPGAYRPTPPAFAPAVFTHWSRVTPFLIDHADEFRPVAPPELTSQRYAAALNEVQSLGQDTSTTRTADQTIAARFWAGPIQNYWNEITQTLVTRTRLDLATAARVFAEVDLSIADSVIAFYDAKYTFALWRPVTAIRLADTDGNPATTASPAWLPLATTPNDPSYPGAHSVVSATAAGVLRAFFGDRQQVSVTSETLPGVTRDFTRLSAIITDAGLSRVYAGVHTRLDHDAGVTLGSRLARATARQL